MKKNDEKINCICQLIARHPTFSNQSELWFPISNLVLARDFGGFDI